MTIKEFNDKHRDTTQVRTSLQDAMARMSEVFEILQEGKTKIPKETMEPIRPHLTQMTTASVEAVKKLMDYEFLMDDVASKTRLDWPPACGIIEKQD